MPRRRMNITRRQGAGSSGRHEEKQVSDILRLLSEDLAGQEVGASYEIDSFQKALSQSVWLFACTYRLAFALASIEPKIVNKKTKDEAKGRKADALRELLRKVNPEETYFDMIEQNVVHLANAGESYIEKVKNRLGETVELWTWNPAWVYPLPDLGSGGRRVRGYRFRLGGRFRDLPPEDVIPIRFYNPTNPLRGMSSTAAIWNDLAADVNASKWNRSMLKRGARSSGIVEPTEGDLTDTEWKRLKESFRHRYEGPDNAGRVTILPSGVKFTPDGISPREMDFLALRKFTREIAAGAIGPAPMMIGNFDSASYANAEAQLRGFWDYVGVPMLLKLFGAMNEHLVAVDPQFDGKFEIIPDLKRIASLIDSMTTRSQNISTLVQGGIMTVNEGRRELGLPPIKDGDRLYLPLNLNPLLTDDLGAGQRAVGEPSDPADPEDQDGDEERENESSASREARQEKAKGRNVARAAHELALRRAELKLGRAVKVYLQKSKVRFLTRIREGGEGSPVDIDSVVGNLEAESREAMRAIAPSILQTIQDAAEITLNRLGLRQRSSFTYERKADAPERLPEIMEFLEGFDLGNPRILAYIERFFLVHLEDLTAVTLEELRKELQAGLGIGEGIAELALRIQRMKSFSPARAEAIARTETIGAFNLGAQEAFREAGTPRKGWLSTRDGDRVRPSHRKIDRETQATPIPSDSKFHLVDEERGSADLMFPGDPEAPAWAVVRCRCAMTPEDVEELAYWVQVCKAEIELAEKNDGKVSFLRV